MRLETKKYTWIPFYEELALKLLSYKANRRALIEHLQSAYDGISMSLPKLDSTVIPADIDPFTVYGLFNKGITEANRKKVIGALSEEFGIEVEQPSDFAGIPLLNNLNATFYAFVGDGRRGEHDIDNLWRVFETAIMLADNDNERTRAEFVEAFNATVVQFGLGWKLGMGLYWVRPRRFINLDSRNRWFMGDMAFAGPELTQASPEEKDAPIHEGEAYLAICDVALAQLGSETCPYATFPELSNAAFEESNRVNEKNGRQRRLRSKRRRITRSAMPTLRLCTFGSMLPVRARVCGTTSIGAASWASAGANSVIWLLIPLRKICANAS